VLSSCFARDCEIAAWKLARDGLQVLIELCEVNGDKARHDARPIVVYVNQVHG
jgi:hypothetical protein